MVKIDLITGFLGSGKTTFIRKYAQYLMDAGNNIGILENDYGAVNVDMMLLQDLMEEHQIGEYKYDMQVPDLNNISTNSTRPSWRRKLFRRG